MRLIQLNLNHCEAAQDLLEQTVREQKVDVAVLSEPYRRKHQGVWAEDNTGGSALWVCGARALQLSNIRSNDGYVRATIGGTTVYSCYMPPSLTTDEFESLVDRLALDVRGRNSVVVAGDFNSWATEWGCRRTTPKGHILMDAFASLDIVLMNTGEATFARGEASSVIDLTFLSSRLVRGATWIVSSAYTHSDHNAIVIDLERAMKTRKAGPRLKGWKTVALDDGALVVMLEELELEGSAEEMASQLAVQLENACDAVMPRRAYGGSHKPVYWWTDEIAGLRKESHTARRRHQRAIGKPECLQLRQLYKEAKGRLKKAIKSSKRRSFIELCAQVEDNPWGMAYRLVMKKLPCYRQPAPSCPILLRCIVEELFPAQDYVPDQLLLELDEEVPSVTTEEVLRAVGKFGDQKAPGPDGIPNRVLKTAVALHPEALRLLYEACLREGIFPTRWKMQRLVLMPKADKPAEDPSAYRPLCMLDTAGKILERIICDRIDEAVLDAGGLARHQYGFRKARSTVDAIDELVQTAKAAIQGRRWKGGAKRYCLVVTLDVKNAFNSASWARIADALAEFKVPIYLRRMIASYFSDRILLYESERGVESHKVTGGVPQGSVLGPLLWNVMYDGILRIQVPDDVKIIGYADDIALLITAKHLEEVVAEANRTVATVGRWLANVGLKLAEHKTEAILVSSRRVLEVVEIRVGNCTISTISHLKYLGVWIDARLSFKEHLRCIGDKAARTCSLLCRIMPNIGGPRQWKRRLIAGVVKSVILYGAPIWAEKSDKKAYVRTMEAAYRRSALRTICAYRTVSTDAALVIAGMIPVDLLAKEAWSLYYGRNTHEFSAEKCLAATRQRTMREWQARWDASEKGRWTKRLIPDLQRWMDRSHGEVNYHVTQLLTGHGGFRAYLHRFRLEETPCCDSCGGTELEDAEHVLFSCPRYSGARVVLERVCGEPVTPDNIVHHMLECSENWDVVCDTSAAIMGDLRQLEWRRRSGNNGTEEPPL